GYAASIGAAKLARAEKCCPSTAASPGSMAACSVSDMVGMKPLALSIHIKGPESTTRLIAGTFRSSASAPKTPQSQTGAPVPYRTIAVASVQTHNGAAT